MRTLLLLFLHTYVSAEENETEVARIIKISLYVGILSEKKMK